jgi:hypothetical protein
MVEGLMLADPYEEDPKPVNYRPWWLDALIELLCFACLGALLALALPGCAEDRWLTKEEDAEMRAACEPVGGCAVIPNPVWKQIQRALGLDDA